MRKLACAIVILAILSCGLLLHDGVHATYVYSQAITGNTTWTIQNSPYFLQGNVVVNNGITLTIQPGVTVNFDGYQLTIAGTLKAQGSIGMVIVFSSSGSSNQRIDFTPTSTSSIVDTALIYSVPIIINGRYTQLSNNYFANTSMTPITVNNGSSSIQNNAINFQSCNGVQINGESVSILNNLIKGQGQNYGIYTQSLAIISNNNITNCFSGIYAVTQSTVQRNNVMYNTNDGIRSDNSASLIQNNAIAITYVGLVELATLKTTQSRVILWGFGDPI